MSRRLTGVLGGTFDPVHLGHVRVAHEIRERLRLERVLLMLSARPPHKNEDELSPAQDRLAMLRLAVEDESGLEVGTDEVDHGEVCYTIDTLRAMRGETPPIEPLFILGMDALVEIPTWRDYEELLAEFDLLVVDRIGGTADTARLVPAVRRRLVSWESVGDPRRADPGSGGRIFRLPLEPIAISSSDIRSRAAAAMDLDGLVSTRVARYIQSHQLYRGQNHRRNT